MYIWVLKWGIYVKIAVNVGYVLGGVLLTNWMDKLSAVSLFLFALKLTFLQGRAARSTVSSHLPLSHRHYKQTMQVCQIALYIKHSLDTSTEVRHYNGHPYNFTWHIFKDPGICAVSGSIMSQDYHCSSFKQCLLLFSLCLLFLAKTSV